MSFFDQDLNSKLNKVCKAASPEKIFIDDGTLLGCLRENKIIPWDTDIDLSVGCCGFEGVMKNLDCLSEEFGQLGVTYIDGIPMSVTFRSEESLPVSLKRFIGMSDGFFMR